MSGDLLRYHRQMLLPGFGERGQRRLSESTAVIVGCGALGCVSADLLARAGVGRLVLVDRDVVEWTNLQRQTLYDERDVVEAIPKAEAARRRLGAINRQVVVSAVVDDLNHRNVERYAGEADVLVDGLDNFETRYLLNDFAVRDGIPWVYGGAVATVGTAFAILPRPDRDGGPPSPCLRCLFPDAPAPGTTPTCDTAGVLAPAVLTVAAFQVAEALKILTGNLDRVCRTLLHVDLWAATAAHLGVAGARERGDCPCCKHGRYEYLDGSRGSSATALCGRDAVQLTHRQGGGTVDLAEVAARLRPHGTVVASPFLLRADITDGGKPYVLSLFPDGRAIVHGTGESRVARGLYAKYVGA